MVIAIILIVAAVLLIKGYEGGKQAKKLSNVCEIGIGEETGDGLVLCWKFRIATAEEIFAELGIGNGADIKVVR